MNPEIRSTPERPPQAVAEREVAKAIFGTFADEYNPERVLARELRQEALFASRMD